MKMQVCSLRIVETPVAAMETYQSHPFIYLSIHEIYFTAVKYVSKFSCWGRHVHTVAPHVPRTVAKFEYFSQIFNKVPSNKFHENQASASRVYTCGWMDGWTDMTHTIGPYANAAKATITPAAGD